MDFKNQVVIITGAGNGIGAATANAFANHKAQLSLVDINEENLNKIAEQCASYGIKPLTIKADVTNDDDAKKIIDQTVQHFGKLNILVNNAGFHASPAFDAEDAMKIYEKTFNTNLRAVIVLSRLAIQHLVKTKGNIVNISSVVANYPTCKHWAYGASKAALGHFSKSLATYLGEKGVRVNVIQPASVKTDLLIKYAGGEAGLEAIKNTTAMKVIIEPQEIADLILFVASDKAKSITGSIFACDAGFTGCE